MLYFFVYLISGREGGRRHNIEDTCKEIEKTRIAKYLAC